MPYSVDLAKNRSVVGRWGTTAPYNSELKPLIPLSESVFPHSNILVPILSATPVSEVPIQSALPSRTRPTAQFDIMFSRRRISVLQEMEKQTFDQTAPINDRLRASLVVLIVLDNDELMQQTHVEPMEISRTVEGKFAC